MSSPKLGLQNVEIKIALVVSVTVICSNCMLQLCDIQTI